MAEATPTGEPGLMAELKTKVSDADVDAFLGLVADPVKQADARTLLEMMMRVTRRPARMWGNYPTQ